MMNGTATNSLDHGAAPPTEASQKGGAAPSAPLGGQTAVAAGPDRGGPSRQTEYLVPFATLKNAVRLVSLKGQLRVDLTYEDFLGVMRRLLQGISVDEAWYRDTYPDVAAAIDAGVYTSAKHHFVSNGYLEGRQPFLIHVDENWYLKTYPDVADGIEDGSFRSAQEHFARHGYEEGRRPSAF